MLWQSVRQAKILKTDPVDLALRRAVGEVLRSLREQHQPKKLAQDRLALEAGLSRSYMGELERGEHDPCLWTLWRLKTALNISLSRLAHQIELHYKPPKHSKPPANRK